jgi:ParB family chromosome partitioning protein
MKDHRATLAAVTQSLPGLTAAANPRERRGVAAAISQQIRELSRTLDKADPEQPLEAALADGKAVVEIDTALIEDTPWRDRAELTPDDPSFKALVDSIRQHGQVAPVALRRQGESGERFDIVFGHRRVHACRLLGIKVQAVIMARDDRDLVVAMLVENQARQDLSPIERAAAYRRILDGNLFDRATLAEILGVTQRQVINILSLNRLDHAVLGALGDARALSLNVGMRLVAALEKAQGGPPADLLEKLRRRAGDANSRARFLIAETDRAAQAIAIEHSIVISDEHGRRYARLTKSGSQLVLRFQPGLDPDVLRDLAQRIPGLYEDLARRR